MPRKRLISPDFFKHSELYEAELTSALPLRIAFAGLWCQADKRGVFRWRPRELKLEIMPYDEDVDFSDVLETLASYDYIRRYSVGGRDYGYIPSFTRWQTFHRNESPSADPDPPESVTDGVDPLQGRMARAWVPREVRNAVMARDGYRCMECQSTQRLTLDHIVPYAKGGTNDLDNLRVLCRSCNGRKGAKLLQPLATPLQPLATAATSPVAVTVAVTDTGTVAGTVEAATGLQPRPADRPAVIHGYVAYQQQLDELLAAGLPHERAALQSLVRHHPSPDVLVLELHAIASGLHIVRGEHTGRAADIADVMRAVAEMAAGAKPFSVSLFRGFCRRVADRPPEPPSAEEREAARLAREIAARQPAVAIEAPRTPEEIERLRAQREAAMAQFRAEFQRYNPQGIAA